jgi:hypothetical protein
MICHAALVIKRRNAKIFTSRGLISSRLSFVSLSLSVAIGWWSATSLACPSVARLCGHRWCDIVRLCPDFRPEAHAMILPLIARARPWHFYCMTTVVSLSPRIERLYLAAKVDVKANLKLNLNLTGLFVLSIHLVPGRQYAPVSLTRRCSVPPGYGGLTYLPHHRPPPTQCIRY